MPLIRLLLIAWVSLQTLAAAPAPRLIAILIDDLHIEFKLTSPLRQMLRQVSTGLLREGDSFAAWSTGYSSVRQGVISDATRLSEIASKVHGSGLSPSDITRNRSAAADLVNERALTASSVLREFLSTLPVKSVRRTALIYISGNPSLDVPALETEASRTGVTIYRFDPRTLADQPGGFENLLMQINAIEK